MSRHSKLLLLVLALPAFVAATARPDERPAPEVTELRVYPADIRLTHRGDTQQFVVQARLADGTTRDVTAAAEVEIGPKPVAHKRQSELSPFSDGAGTLKTTYFVQNTTISLAVVGSERQPAVSFRRDILPVLTKAGCNSGACHGSSRGKDGFRLSVLGYDPAADYDRLTREQPGRRIDVTNPAESLLLLKACGRVPHSGGALIAEDSSLYAELLRWLEAGAPDDESAALAHLTPTRLVIEPPEAVFAQAGASQQFIVRAFYADGTDRDVTRLVRYKTSDEGAASVTPAGLVTARARGETFITAAFGTLLVGAEVTVAPRDGAARPPRAAPSSFSPIDLAVDAKLRKLRLEPSPPCDDDTFVRRLYLDLAGRLPTPDERSAFLDDAAADRRGRLIDRLLAAPEFVDLWTMRLGELLGLRSHPALPILGVSYKGTEAYHRKLREYVAADTPLDVLVRELLTASGTSFAQPEVHYYLYEQDTLNLAENTAQALLGVRLKCARCHNHPFDRWTMDDYYGFAAFFARIERKRAADPRERTVGPAKTGDVEHPVTKQPVAPRFLGGDTAVITGDDRRPALAAWLTAADNPWFARHAADLVWSHFFGAGIVEPIDDVRITNPPANAALRDLLAARLVELRFDVRALMREICNSQTYQRSSLPNASNRTDERHLARWPVRRLRAEVLLDALCQVTESPERLPRTPTGTRAVQLADGATTNYFLTTFGRSPRRTVCACETNMEPTLAQSLHLLNGDTIESKIRAGGVVHKQLATGTEPAAVLRNLYERTLARSLTADEEAELSPLLAAAPDKREFLEDILWGLLNSREFTFHH